MIRSRVRCTDAHHLLGGRIKEEKASIRIGNNHAIGNASQDQLKECFLAFCLLLCPLLFRDIPKNEHDPEPFTCVRKNGRSTVFDVIFCSVLREQERVVGQTDNLSLAEHFLDRVLRGAARFLVHDI